MAHRILVADDQEASRKGLSALLRAWGYETDEAADGQEALDKAVASRPAVVITDLVMPRLDGIGLLKALQADVPFAMVIILTGHGTIESAVGATRDGAYDYLTKPVDTARLRLLVQKALEKGAALREVSVLRRRVKDVWGHGRLVGTGRAMQEVYRLIDLAAPTAAPVLIHGESGTGKELVARTLHDLGPRHDGPLVAVNCAAIPETLLESEIFGHEKGAFTGALERRIGCFELAHRGTIFLDEIAEMTPALQAKFLRILEDGSVKRIGGKAEIRVDVRVVAATNRDPARAIQDGMFREDLYYRLNVFTIPLPPLRERKEDLALLIEGFVEELNAKYDRKVRGLDDAALALLAAHDWPGNVRELRNTMERAVVACSGDLITPAHLPAGLGARPAREPAPAGPALPAAGAAAAGPGGEVPAGMRLRDLEREAILKTLAAVNHNKTRAAQLLGISLKTLHNKLNRYGA